MQNQRGSIWDGLLNVSVHSEQFEIRAERCTRLMQQCNTKKVEYEAVCSRRLNICSMYDKYFRLLTCMASTYYPAEITNTPGKIACWLCCCELFEFVIHISMNTETRCLDVCEVFLIKITYRLESWVQVRYYFDWPLQTAVVVDNINKYRHEASYVII